MSELLIGPGGDYATFREAYAALVAGPDFTETVTCRQIGNIVGDGWLNAPEVPLNGYDLIFTVGDDDWHKGDPTAGYSIEITNNNYALNLRQKPFQPGGGLIVERLRVKKTSSDFLSTKSVIGLTSGAIFSTGTPKRVARDCIVEAGSGGTYAQIGISAGNTAIDYVEISNCKVFKAGNTGISLNVSGGTTGTFNGRRKVENCIVDQCGVGYYLEASTSTILGAYDYFVKNLSAIRCSTGFTAIQAPTCTIENCAEDDGSLPAWATDSQESITPLDEYASLVNTESNYLKLKPYNPNLVLGGGGIASTLETTDIAGLTYGAGGLYPIGPHQVDLEPYNMWLGGVGLSMFGREFRRGNIEGKRDVRTVDGTLKKETQWRKSRFVISYSLIDGTTLETIKGLWDQQSELEFKWTDADDTVYTYTVQMGAFDARRLVLIGDGLWRGVSFTLEEV